MERRNSETAMETGTAERLRIRGQLASRISFKSSSNVALHQTESDEKSARSPRRRENKRKTISCKAASVWGKHKQSMKCSDLVKVMLVWPLLTKPRQVTCVEGLWSVKFR